MTYIQVLPPLMRINLLIAIWISVFSKLYVLLGWEWFETKVLDSLSE